MWASSCASATPQRPRCEAQPGRRRGRPGHGSGAALAGRHAGAGVGGYAHAPHAPGDCVAALCAARGQRAGPLGPHRLGVRFKPGAERDAGRRRARRSQRILQRDVPALPARGRALSHPLDSARRGAPPCMHRVACLPHTARPWTTTCLSCAHARRAGYGQAGVKAASANLCRA